MKKSVLAVLVSVGLLAALNAPIDRGLIDTNEGPIVTNTGGPNHGLHPLSVTVAYTDSSRNQYTFWTQIQDPIYVTEDGDTIVFSYRGYETDGTGFIAATFSGDGGNTWINVRRLNEAAGTIDGGGRYPSGGFQGGLPLAIHPELTSGPIDWGYATSLTGDWSGNASNWYGERSADVDVHKNVPMRLPDNSRIVNLLSSTTSGFMYAIYDAINGFYETPPTAVDPSFSVQGGDFLGNTIMAFGFDGSGNPAYYTYDPSTGSWSAPTTLPAPDVETLPNGEVLNRIYWADGIILNDGTPMMIMDVGDGSGIDTVFASRTVWVTTPSGAVKVLDAGSTDPVWHVAYAQLSIDRANGTVYAFWMQLDEWRGDTTGYGSWDIWYSSSSDNGATWSTPANLTNTTGEDENMFQVAKRVVNGKAWLAYLRAMPGRTIDLYWQVWTGFAGGVWPTYDYLVYAEGLGVSESGSGIPARFDVDLMGSNLRLMLPKAGNVGITLYDISGRALKSLNYELGAGTHTLSLPVNSLSKGVYLVNVNTITGTRTLKLVRF